MPSLTVNSAMDVFLQVLQDFQNTAVFKTIFKNTFCQWVNRVHVQLDNIFFWKLHVFKIDIFYLSQFNSIFRKEYHWTWTWKISDCLTRLGLTLWCVGLGLEKYLNYFTALGLILWLVGVRVENYWDYLTGFGLILWHIGLGLKKHLD